MRKSNTVHDAENTILTVKHGGGNITAFFITRKTRQGRRQDTVDAAKYRKVEEKILSSKHLGRGLQSNKNLALIIPPNLEWFKT